MRSRHERGSQRGRVYHGPDRRTGHASDEVEPVVLTRKLAEAIDGVNLEGHDVGDRLPLRRREAQLLIAEGWALPTTRDRRRRTLP